MKVGPLRFSVHHERSYVKNRGATVEDEPGPVLARQRAVLRHHGLHPRGTPEEDVPRHHAPRRPGRQPGTFPPPRPGGAAQFLAGEALPPQGRHGGLDEPGRLAPARRGGHARVRHRHRAGHLRAQTATAGAAVGEGVLPGSPCPGDSHPGEHHRRLLRPRPRLALHLHQPPGGVADAPVAGRIAGQSPPGRIPRGRRLDFRTDVPGGPRNGPVRHLRGVLYAFQKRAAPSGAFRGDLAG
jgi:hypothetical protein